MNGSFPTFVALLNRLAFIITCNTTDIGVFWLVIAWDFYWQKQKKIFPGGLSTLVMVVDFSVSLIMSPVVVGELLLLSVGSIEL